MVVTNRLGFVSSAAAVLTVVDTTPPTIGCPSNLVVTIRLTTASVAYRSLRAGSG